MAGGWFQGEGSKLTQTEQSEGAGNVGHLFGVGFHDGGAVTQ